MNKRITTAEQIKSLLNHYENEVIVAELLADRYGWDLYDVFSIVFNYRMAFKNYKEMTDEEIIALISRPKTFKDRNSNQKIV